MLNNTQSELNINIKSDSALPANSQRINNRRGSLEQEEKKQPHVVTPKKKMKAKNSVAAVLLMLYQILVAIMLGLFFQVPATQPTSAVKDVIINGFLLVMVIVGFGLIFGYYYKLGWSALGFNLLLAALSIESYIMWNATFSKSNLYTEETSFSDTSRYPIYLYPIENIKNYHPTLVEATKCALSSIIAFSCVIGRVGVLEVFYFGTILPIGYELIRQVGLYNGIVDMGTFKIFGFGSSVGLMISLLLRCKQPSIKHHVNHIQTEKSRVLTLLGLIFLLVFFPLLKIDSDQSLSETQQKSKIVSLVFVMVSSMIVAINLSYFFGGFKTIISCSLAGPVAALSSIPYMTLPFQGLAIGCAAALLQYGVLYLDKKVLKKYGPIDSFGFVFFIQSLIGTFCAFLFYSVYIQRNNLQNASAVEMIGIGWLAIGLGIGFGGVLGIWIALFNYHEQHHLFSDFAYWRESDSITTQEVAENPKSQEIDEEENQRQIVNQQHFTVKKDNIRQKHSYL